MDTSSQKNILQHTLIQTLSNRLILLLVTSSNTHCTTQQNALILAKAMATFDRFFGCFCQRNPPVNEVRNPKFRTLRKRIQARQIDFLTSERNQAINLVGLHVFS